ncbi:MAG: acyltransferase [Candidatus Omnitrophica bacterium]|nr:acyltransferase [Candidatus Omnitrophota bacterium]
MRKLLKIIGDYRAKMKICKYRRSITEMIERGLKIGRNVTIGPTAWFDYDYCYLISVGNNCAISKGSKIFAHDATVYKYTGGYTRIGKVEIKDNCYIAENCIILPGVTIGPNVLVAAGSVVNKDIPPNSCVAGVPARFYSKFDDFLEKQKEKIGQRPVFDFCEIMKGVTPELKEKIKEAVKDDVAYVQGYQGRFPWLWNVD